MRAFPLLFLSALTFACFAFGDGGAADLSLRFAPPDAAHVLGRDELGRDVLARLLQGGQVSIAVGVITAFFAAGIGLAAGLAAGYFGGKTDAALMRLTDFLIALPLLPLLIILSAVDLSKMGIDAHSDFASLAKVIILMTLAGWTGVARLVRARVLTIREMPYVMAARALGQCDGAIIRRHILPNLMDTVMVAATLSAGQFILMESVLSFLGLGIAPPMASWGNMLTNAEENIWEHPHLAVYPGVMIFVTVLCLNLAGEAKSRRLSAAR